MHLSNSDENSTTPYIVGTLISAFMLQMLRNTHATIYYSLLGDSVPAGIDLPVVDAHYMYLTVSLVHLLY